MNDFNAQLYSSIALQNADELTGNNEKDKLLAYLGTQAGTQLLTELFKTTFNQPKTSNGNSKVFPKLKEPKPSLNASPSEFFGYKDTLNSSQSLEPKLSQPSSPLQQTPQQFFNQNVSTVVPTAQTPQVSNQNVSVVVPTKSYSSTQNLTLDNSFNIPTQSQGSMNQSISAATEGLSNNISSGTTSSAPKSSLVSGGAGIVGGIAGQYAGSKLGGLLFDNNSKGGAFASGLVGQAGSMIASTAASNLASTGTLSLSGLGSAASLGQGAMGVANIALDVFDPVKKSKGENIAGLGLGAAGAAAALAGIPGVGWAAGGALLAANVLGHALGKKSDSFTMNKELYSKMGSSYGGSVDKASDALAKSNQKYSAFNSGARKEANQEIMEAKRQQNVIENISNEATDLQDISNYMASINSDRLQFEMNGGYDQDSIRVGRVGFKMNKIHSIIQKAQKGTKLIDPYQHFLSTLPHNLQNEDGEYRMRELWEWNGRPKDFKSAQHLFSLVDGVFHAPSVSENPQGVLEFLKSPKHPSIHLEEEWYNSPEGAPFKERFELIKSEPYWKYVERTTPQKFQNGGAVNVIPEGALHARKNNMDIEGITKKGIPVISEDGGKIQQHAEIERNEVILRLEVTQKIEELSKVYYSESSSEEEKEKAALEAGKLLSDEIINNTQDNTGLINDESRQK